MLLERPISGSPREVTARVDVIRGKSVSRELCEMLAVPRPVDALERVDGPAVEEHAPPRRQLLVHGVAQEGVGEPHATRTFRNAGDKPIVERLLERVEQLLSRHACRLFENRQLALASEDGGAGESVIARI